MFTQLAVGLLDPYFVREEELAAIIEKKTRWTRRWKVFNVNDAVGSIFMVPQSHYWVIDLVNATIGTGPAAAAFLGQINFYKPYDLTGGAGDLTYFIARTDAYAGANTVFYQIGGGGGFADSEQLEYIDMDQILLEPGDAIHIFVDGAAALSSFYGVLWYWEKVGEL